MLGCRVMLGPRVMNLATLQGISPYADTDCHYQGNSQIQSLDLNLEATSVIIRKGDRFEILTHGLKPADSEVRDGWNTEYSVRGKEAVFSASMDDDQFLAGSNPETVVQVTVPEAMKNLTVNLSMGGLELSGISLQSIDAVLDMGTLKLSGVMAGSLNASVSMGDADMRNVDMQNGTVTVDMGSLTMTGCKVTGQLDAEVSMGSATMDLRQKNALLDLNADMGDLTVNGTKAESGILCTNTKETETGKGPVIRVGVSMGSLDLDLDGDIQTIREFPASGKAEKD
ncbi:DUF4097 family beta strand repeat-containing protein [Faecalibaculum rodentium]|nr:DUF4097 family beta strand repeat-containing protein [Faecalibaculum rodentium]